MNTPKKVIWAEGVYLGQQHFQQWDRYLEHQQYLQRQALTPLAWGVRRLTVDPAGLQNGLFKINHCEVIFRTGEMVAFNSHVDGVLSCHIPDKPGEVINIYLCLPLNHKISGIVGYPAMDQSTTYRARFDNVIDNYDPTREREVMLGDINLSLCADEVQCNQFATLKIAKIISDGAGQYALDPTFIPSCIHLKSSPILIEMLDRIILRIVAKINGLIATPEIESKHLRLWMMLKDLNSILPVLQYLQQNTLAHPVQFYLLLCSCVGGLATCHPLLTIGECSSYTHDDLGQTFIRLEQQLTVLLNEIGVSATQSYELKREQELLYSISELDPTLMTNAILFIAVHHGSGNAEWTNNFVRHTKIGSRNQIEAIVSSALPGAELVYQQRLPKKLLIKAGYEYFRLDAAGRCWEQIKEESSLAIFITREFSNARIEIVSIQA